MEETPSNHDQPQPKPSFQPDSSPLSPSAESTIPAEESIFSESDYSMEGYDKHIRYARNALFIVSGIQLIAIFTLNAEEGLQKTIAIGIVVFIALIFFGLALWTKKKPFTALLIALIIYASLLIFDAILDPTTLFHGILIKAAVIIALITGLRNAKEGEDLKKAFGKDR